MVRLWRSNMWQGRTRELAKIWDAVGGRQISSIPADTNVTGDAPLSNGYVYLRTPQAGYTKTQWLTGYALVVVTPPPPPPPPPPTVVTLRYTIEIFSDGSIVINGIPYP